MNFHAQYFNIFVSAVNFLLHKSNFGFQSSIFISKDIKLDFYSPCLVLQFLLFWCRKSGVQRHNRF